MSSIKFLFCLLVAGIPSIYNNNNNSNVVVSGFSLVPRPLTKNPLLRTTNSVPILLAKPEFSMAEDHDDDDDDDSDDDDDDEAETKLAKDAVVTTTADGGVVTITATEIRYKKPQEPTENEKALSSQSQSQSQPRSQQQSQSQHQHAATTTTTTTTTTPKFTSIPPEYGALAPGTVVQVQIGDLSLARKAWKKRRRTGSPLLVPCSILTVDRNSMVRWNLIHLLEKFGRAQSDGIAMTEVELSQQYKIFLKSSLLVRVLLYACFVFSSSSVRSMNVPFSTTPRSSSSRVG